jgi:hypothetical protein
MIAINVGARVTAPVHIDPAADALVDAAEISPTPRGPRRYPPVRTREHVLSRSAGALA